MPSLHASCVELDGRGLLLRGPPGAGKSDLALRLIEAGARLVADDRVVLSRRDGALIARPARELAGLLEVRGLGVVSVPHVRETALHLVVDLVPLSAVERLPEPASVVLEGVSLPLHALCAFEASAVAKLKLALAQIERPGARPRATVRA
jgi:serine kinase of HPr protein (carbohydrate metabolism regulator)